MKSVLKSAEVGSGKIWMNGPSPPSAKVRTRGALEEVLFGLDLRLCSPQSVSKVNLFYDSLLFQLGPATALGRNEAIIAESAGELLAPPPSSSFPTPAGAGDHRPSGGRPRRLTMRSWSRRPRTTDLVSTAFTRLRQKAFYTGFTQLCLRQSTSYPDSCIRCEQSLS